MGVGVAFFGLSDVKRRTLWPPGCVAALLRRLSGRRYHLVDQAKCRGWGNVGISGGAQWG
ncbi:hypothetical protein I549_4030 [Mycobacterium avium subsp. avium 2285 (R)]|nr:hypothetical protein L837_4960 [Mycobacterium avium MAV_061107_1842]EUA40809.1 hypothetical protein I549_4030 [Mycobacterium avium subsp. avium 2285 (R)]